jgi:hypothetical protein
MLASHRFSARAPSRRLRTASLFAAFVLITTCSIPGLAETKAETATTTTEQTADSPDGQHDFDFEFGSWKVHLKRLLHPLSGSNSWVELDGTSIVRKVWDGRANLGELEASNSESHIEGLSLRLYNPQTHQWSIYWASSRDGNLGTPPMVGQFTDGRGEFFDHELFNGASIQVRFIFSDISPTSFRLEQAFSADGGKTWEPNWISDFTR